MYRNLLIVFALCLANAAFAQDIKKVKIQDLKSYIEKSDHPLVVNFWATWCAPCNKEIPYFQEEVKNYADQKAELVLVSLDFATDYPNKISAFIKKNNYNAHFFWLNETNADVFCPSIDPKWSGSIPSTLFVNNKKSYRKFFERQLTHPQFVIEMKSLVQ